MRWSLPADRAQRMLGWLLPALALVAEGAWLTVVYVAIETTIGRQAPLLGTFEMTLAAALAAMAVRRGWLRPDDDPLTFLAALLAVGAVGWLWDAGPRDLLLAGRPLDAIGLHPGGWLTLVAFMRGVGRGIEIDDRALTRLVLVGIPGLAVPWVAGQFAPASLRAAFTTEAFVASLTFVSAGFMAAGLARLQEIGRETGLDWRRNRSWLALVLAVLGAVLAIGLPAAALLGLPVDAVTRGLLGPIAGLLGYLLLGIAIVMGVLATVVYAILSGIGIVLPPPAPFGTPTLGGSAEYTFEQLRGPLLTVGVAWVVLVLLAFILLRTWLRRRTGGPGRRRDEERSFRIPDTTLRLGLPRLRIRPRRPTAPRDAVTAYLATLADLAAHRDGALGRLDAETPRVHARRVLPETGPELASLQADYALARYGGRTLSRLEHRRALARWRRLRDRLRHR